MKKNLSGISLNKDLKKFVIELISLPIFFVGVIVSTILLIIGYIFKTCSSCAIKLGYFISRKLDNLDIPDYF